ncbi:cytotoxic translational repressor of toxin-antitoxin stability system [Mycetocola zhujimingii]|uniref:Cytotoxic translational repressor of toxin-antitoxin stability system n=1 Tax=Mycetocola zhujimingii TaxID=2079792 RepID=A0A2U1TGU6_9MICO|nr:cytotoxic translational repressor of toxin-antitoxin stability system [Mycetocola zhujimingii]PWC08117.1 cytotoxic translational repressor of toxin-antitoxin stability system [Mycetocola zhujimingii]
MSKHPAPTREHHDDFCTTERWQLVRGAAGKPVAHHRTYELTLWDGRILRTRISKPVDTSTYGASMWSHILRQQLEVDAGTFWACVQNGTLPDRGAPVTKAHKDAVPYFLVHALTEMGVEENDVLALTPAEAAALLAEKMKQQFGEDA